METYGQINNLLKEIENDSASQVEAILKEANEFADNKIKQAEREVTIRKRRIIKEAEKQAEDIKRRLLSNVNMEINRFALKEREDIINQIINNIEKKIADFIENNTDEYRNFLFKLVVEIIDTISDESIFILFDNADKKTVDKNFIQKILTRAHKNNIKIDTDDIIFENNIGHGVIVKVKNKNLIYNNTIKDRLERKKEEFRLEIYEELFGGA